MKLMKNLKHILLKKIRKKDLSYKINYLSIFLDILEIQYLSFYKNVNGNIKKVKILK